MPGAAVRTRRKRRGLGNKKLTSERGYMSLLLDIEEVRALVRAADYDGFTACDLQSSLQMHGGTVRRRTP